MSGIDFARSDLSPGLLCELVLKDEVTFQVNALEIFPKTGGGGGAPIYNRGYGCASGIVKPLPFADQNFDKNFGPFADKWWKSFENIYPKMLENKFLALYLIIEKISYLINENKILQKFEALIRPL